MRTRLGTLVTRGGIFSRRSLGLAYSLAAGPQNQAKNLREFVRKNHRLPVIFDNFKSHPEDHQENLDRILRAVNQNEFSGDTFSELLKNQDTLEHLLYLMEDGKIPLWQGVTLYQYISAAGQFSNKELLSPLDKDTYSPRKFKMVTFVENGKLTDEGQRYLELFIQRMENRISIKLNFDELAEFFIHAPKIEQYAMVINYKWDDYTSSGVDNASDHIIRIIDKSVPFFHSPDNGTFMYPSATFMNFILNKMSDRPVHGKPMLGSIGDARRLVMHEQGEHPIPLYNRNILSNIKLIHENRTGSVAGNVHDWAHLFWMNMLTQAERDLILQRLIPMLERLKCQHEKKSQSDLAPVSGKLVWQLGDFDLLSKSRYSHPETRLFEYIIVVINAHATNANVGSKEKYVERNVIILTALKSFIEEERSANRMTESLEKLLHCIDKYLYLAKERKRAVASGMINLENVHEYVPDAIIEDHERAGVRRNSLKQ